jgi:hypothetical protein
MQLDIQDVRLLAIEYSDAQEFFNEFQDMRERLRQREYREASPGDDSVPEMFDAFEAGDREGGYGDG